MVRLKNGVTFHGVSTPFYPRGERHDYASAIVFPDGTKVRGYRYDFGLIDGDEGAKILTGSIEAQANGRKVGTKFTADSIEYPDGRKVENPSADEIDALFPKEGCEREVEIGATIKIGTFVSGEVWRWKFLEADEPPIVIVGGPDGFPSEDAALEDAMCLLDQANGEENWMIDNVIHVRADGTFTTVSVADLAHPSELFEGELAALDASELPF
jgi:hypothetical protein